jgi:energy-coupling factor transporter ATP-binding protein EcfA2/cytochrome c-type biogenesis protein CcmH/NrfG
MTDTARDASNGHHEPYPSMSTLKEAHVALLRRHRQGGDVGLLDNVEEFLTRGSATGVYLDSIDDRMAGQSLLDYWVTVLYKAKRTPLDATLAEFDPQLSPALDDSLCPYRGLNAFQEEDSDLFHGRQRLVEQLVQKARTERLLFVVGPSGSGKSSLVLAGLIPTLRNGILEGSARWRYFPRMVPGSNPLRNLAAALRDFYSQTAEWAAEQARLLREDPRHLLRLLDDSEEPAVLIIDQFEEVFTLCLDDGLRESFAAALAVLAESDGARHLALITMRTDYESQLVHLPTLTPLLERGQVRITPLTAADLHEAIEEPARRIGLKFEDGIVDALVKDILGEPAGLPLLQFTLLRLWKMREDGRSRITWAAYKRLGGARRALALTADEFYEHLPEEKKVTAKRILLRMVRPSGTSEVMSNRVKRSSLSFEAQHRIDDVLDELHRAGLVRVTRGDTPGNDQIEVAHEALVRNWPLLVEWVEHDRVSMRQRLRLTAAAEQWYEHGKDEGGLLGGSLLAEALQYDASELNELEREYVRASQEAAGAIEAEKADAAERERRLEQERLLALEQKAAEEAKNARRLRLFVPILAVVTLFALAAAAFGFVGADRARKSATEAQESRVVAEREQRRAEDESQNVKRLLKETQDAKDAAETAEANARKQTEIAESKSHELESKSRELESKSRELAAKNRELTALTAEVQRLAGIDQHRAQLAEIHRQADSLVNSDPERAERLLDQLGDYTSDPKDFDPDGSKTMNVLRTQVKVYRNLSDKRMQTNDKAGAEEYAGRAKRVYEQALKMWEERLKAVEEKAGADGMALVPVLEEKAQYFEYLGETGSALAEKGRALDILEKGISNGTLGHMEFWPALRKFDELVEQMSKLYGEDEAGAAEMLHQRALALRTANASQPGMGIEVHNGYVNLGKFYLGENKFGKAEKAYRDAINTIKQMSWGDADHDNRYITPDLMTLADALTNQYDSTKNEEAVAVYKQLMENLEKSGGDRMNEEGEILLKLVPLYTRLHKDADAETATIQAAEAYERSAVKDVLGLYSAQISLGNLYLRKERYDKAEEVFRKLDALTAAEPSLKGQPRVIALNRLGDAYFKQNKLKDAERVYLQILSLPEKETRRFAATVSLALTETYLREGEMAKAEAQGIRAAAAANKAYSLENEVESINLLGQVYEKQGKYAEAEAQYKVALEKSRGSVADDQRVKVLENYARLLTTLNRKDEAAKMLEEANKLREELKDSRR